MPAPTEAFYSVDAIETAHIEFRDLIDAGAGAGKIVLLSETDVLLSEIPLSDPCGTVSAVTGRLDFSIAGPDTSADATGVCTYAVFADSDDNVHLTMPVQEGTSPVSGYLVMNTADIIATAPVTIVAATIG